MPTSIQSNLRVRRSFTKIQKVIEIPNLINIQKQSYEKFLQADIAPDKREDLGLQGVFKSVFPIRFKRVIYFATYRKGSRLIFLH